MPLTGWQESVPLGTVAVSAVALVRNGGWINEIYTVAKSFTWFGAWSFITLRTWMYLVLEVCALGGMVIGIARGRSRLRAPLTFTICFMIAIAGGAAAYYAVHGIAGIPGWYLWPAGGVMAILIVAGLGRFSIVFVLMLWLVDIFGAGARMMPYYAGLAERNHGSLTQLPLAAGRLHVPGWLVVAWLVATVADSVAAAQGPGLSPPQAEACPTLNCDWREECYTKNE